MSKTLKPERPAKPPDLAKRLRTRLAQTNAEQRGLISGQSADITQSTKTPPSQDSSSSDDKQQLTSKDFNGSFDDLDIPYIDEAED